MKVLVTDYTFNALAKTITFSESIPLERLLIITNVTTNTIIYNFADINTGGVVSDNVLTLSYNTADMSNTDKLQIFIEGENTNFNALFLQVLNKLNDQIQENNTASTELVRSINSFKILFGFPDIYGRLRVAVEANANIATVTTVTNMNTLNGHPSSQLILGTTNLPAKQLRNKIDIV